MTDKDTPKVEPMTANAANNEPVLSTGQQAELAAILRGDFQEGKIIQLILSRDQARRERDDTDLSWAKRYDQEVQFLQQQNSEFLQRAIKAEHAASHVAPPASDWMRWKNAHSHTKDQPCTATPPYRKCVGGVLDSGYDGSGVKMTCIFLAVASGGSAPPVQTLTNLSGIHTGLLYPEEAASLDTPPQPHSFDNTVRPAMEALSLDSLRDMQQKIAERIAELEAASRCVEANLGYSWPSRKDGYCYPSDNPKVKVKP